MSVVCEILVLLDRMQNYIFLPTFCIKGKTTEIYFDDAVTVLLCSFDIDILELFKYNGNSVQALAKMNIKFLAVTAGNEE
ncbi:unnamed protein product [Larinioides sclopetarius]|uniref:Uncharacterized protein n=1 Tax=Larinioides sclopetarius TaxID=280406 RepID=A0AAV1YZV7_9ARAC